MESTSYMKTFDVITTSYHDVPDGASNETDPLLHRNSLSTWQIIKCSIGCVMSIWTILGQIIVFIIATKNPQMRTPNNQFIISLALADLLVGLICAPVWTVYTTLHYWPFSQVFCDIWNILDTVLCNVTLYTVLFITCDRYLALKYPLTYRVTRTSSFVKSALVCIWIGCSILFTMFLVVTQQMYGKVRNLQECTVYYTRSIPLTLAKVFVSIWGPLLVNSFVYILIYRTVKTSVKLKNTSAIKTISSKLPDVGISDPLPSAMSQENCKKYPSSKTTDSNTYLHRLTKTSQKSTYFSSRLKNLSRNVEQVKEEGKQNKAIKTIALLSVSLGLCWLPWSMVVVMKMVYPLHVSASWQIVTFWLGYFNSTINPLCYAMANPHFKETFLLLFCTFRTK